jgi:chromosome segregation ATPase
MINLDQVRTLEWKVKQAVQLIVHLRRENDTLRGRLSDTEVRLQELEALLESVKASQSEMESGIRSALEELDHLEGADREPSEVSAPVDPLSYPPASADATQDPPLVVEEKSAETSEDASFEVEFAALAAAEAASLVDQEPVADSSEVPASVELEAGKETSPASEDAHEPEQPGLGIF